MGDVTDLSQLHGRGHRRPGVRQAQGGDRRGPSATAGLDDRSPAAQYDDTRRLLRAADRRRSPTDPTDEMFTTEYFGPILAVHVYDDARLRHGAATRWSRSRRTR